MEKLQFDSFYKFVASLGVVSVAASITLPFVYLRDLASVSIKVADYSALLPAAQKLIDSRMSVLSTLNLGVLIAAGILFALGLALIIWAMIMWYPRQRVVDETEDVGLEEARFKLTKMSESDKQKKAIVEAANAPAVEADPGEEAGAPREDTVIRAMTLQEQYREIETRMETALVQQLKRRQESWELVSGVKMGTDEYDFLVKRLGPSRQDYLIEVKIAGPVVRVDCLRDAIISHVKRTKRYADALGRNSKPIVLFFTIPIAAGRIRHRRELVTGILRDAQLTDVTVEFVPMERVDSFNYVDLLQ